MNVNGSDDSNYQCKKQPITNSYILRDGGITIIDNAKQIAHDIYPELTDL